VSARFRSIEALQADIASNPNSIDAIVSQALSDLDGLGRKIHAVAYVASDHAATRVETLRNAAAQNRHNKASALLGIPFAHKQLYMREGWPCDGGSQVLAGHRAERTAFATERLDVAGAVDCARLTSVEFALGTTGHNAYAGTPVNPWNRAYICGGSSSGSAAVVAAGIVPASLGSDTGGSVRLPAAACGLVGVKPTHGLIGRSGLVALSPTLDTVGPLTRSVCDAAIVLEAIAGTDESDSSSVQVDPSDYLASIEAGIKGVRIGWPTNHFFDDVDAGVADRVAGVFELAGRLGGRCVDVAVPGIETANGMTMLIIAVEGAALHERAILKHHESFCAQTLARLLVGAFVPARDYHNALANRARAARRTLDTTFRQVDIVVTPVWPYPLPTIEESDVGARPGAAAMALRSGHNTRPVNYLGFPAVNIPTGFDANGLPMSVQLIGAPFTEARLLRVARALERELDFWSTRPNLDAITT
jgi:aspartyl-tRNA(Asn)/glutamyl-tRNA(Gln) amidotransferase subunit A